MEKETVFIYSLPEDSSGFLLWQVSNLRHKLINVELQKLDLTYVQFIIMSSLLWLNQRNGNINQITLVKFAKLDKSMTSSVLKTLIEKQLIGRVEDKIDTRAKLIYVTENGKQKLKEALKIAYDFDLKFFGFKQTKSSDFNQQLMKIIDMNS